MTAAPLSAKDFADHMAALGPFEQSPHLACAVSGGADSLALALLAHQWARARGGRVTALTVDHRLRPESADEARRVAGSLAERGIAHETLTWESDAPASGLQAAARTARYRLLEAWCRRGQVLHLLLGHHRDDQAETVLLRVFGGSGTDGLAAMAAVRETAAVRILRPLLDCSPARLRATLEAWGQPWLEDPSNADLRFARNRLRATRTGLEGAGLTAPSLAATARDMGRARFALENAACRLLAEAARLRPEGFAWLDLGALSAAPDAVALRALARVLLVVGGGVYGPRGRGIESLLAGLRGGAEFSGASLAGCRIVAATDDRVLVCREVRGPGDVVPITVAGEVAWDHRFRLGLFVHADYLAGTARVARLGEAGWRQVVSDAPDARTRSLPHPVRLSLPALWDEKGVFAVPHLDYNCGSRPVPRVRVVRSCLRPHQSLSGSGFFLAP